MMKTTLGRHYRENWEKGQNYAHCRVSRYYEGKGWATRLYKRISRATFARLNMVNIAALEGDNRKVHLIVH